MIHNIRIDYHGNNENIDLQKLTEFIEEIHELLMGITDEINNEQAILVIKVYDGKRMNYSFENISSATAEKVILYSRP